MDASNSVWKALIDIFVAPAQALRAVRNQSNWLWAPLILIVASTLALLWAYYLNVDMDWLRQHMMSMSQVKLSEAQMEQAAQHMGRTPMLIGASIGSLAPVIWGLLIALYLHIVDKSTRNRLGSYAAWFALVLWCSMPQLLTTLGMAINFATASAPLGPEQLSVTNLNALVFHLPLSDSWGKLLNGLDLSLFWSVALMGLGVAQWTERRYGKALAIAAAPYLVLYGLWALVIAIF